MYRTESQIKTLILQYVHELKKIKIRPKEVLLYGSYAKGNAHKYSDIDLVVISDDFKKNKPLNRLEILSRATIPLNAPIEALGYTPAELKKYKHQSIFWSEIKDFVKTVYKSR